MPLRKELFYCYRSGKEIFFILPPSWIQSADTNSQAVSRKTVLQVFQNPNIFFGNSIIHFTTNIFSCEGDKNFLL